MSSEADVMRNRIAGALRGGALADALGYRAQRGDDQVHISTHTQLSLYVADGLLEVMEWAAEGSAADPAASVWLALLRWYRARFGDFPAATPRPMDRWIDAHPELGAARAPEVPDVVSGLQHTEMRLLNRVANPEASGPEALTRSVGYGLLITIDAELRSSLVHQGAVLTHGSEQAWQPAAAFAQSIAELVADGRIQTPYAREPESTADPESAPAVFDRAVRLWTEHENWSELVAALEADPNPATVGTVAGALWGAQHGERELINQAGTDLDELVEGPVVAELAERWTKLIL